jgi:hypothetical protein
MCIRIRCSNESRRSKQDRSPRADGFAHHPTWVPFRRARTVEICFGSKGVVRVLFLAFKLSNVQ